MERNPELIRSLRQHVAKTREVAAVVSRLEGGRINVTSASPEARALLLASIAEVTGRRLVVVVPSDARLTELEHSLRLFHERGERVMVYPAPSLSPYQDVDPSLAVQRDEIRALASLLAGEVDILVVPARALYNRVPSPDALAARVVRFESGTEIDPRGLVERLVENGYTRTDLVGEIGEFAFRGGIIDLFPPNLEQPVRIELFGDTIESIRHFEIDTQRSGEAVESLAIDPLFHFDLSKKTRDSLAQRLSVDFNDPLYRYDLSEKIDKLQETGRFPGIESCAHIAAGSVSLTGFLAAHGDWMVVPMEPGEIEGSLDKYDQMLRSEYDAATARGRAVYAPDKLLTPPDEIHAWVGAAPLALSSMHVSDSGREEIRLRAPESPRFVNRLGELAPELEKAREAGYRAVLFITTRGGREKAERLLREFSIPYEDNPPSPGEALAVTGGTLPSGFMFEPAKIAILSEWDLFDPPTHRKTAPKRRTSDAFLSDLRDLKVGDFVVHVDHGVGMFRGLQRIPFGEAEREVMEIEYSAKGKLLLPMESLHLVQKYSGGADAPPKLDKLGGTAWARTKASVRKAMRDMADELIKLYATRRMIGGHAFATDTPWQKEFEDAFEFDETEDQAAAIDDVKNDMESRKPMDRLLCGDVGYGKTEVAMRAAFKAAMDGRQVAVLAPTTILAYQHYRTFLRRFASFPVQIELLSRFRSPKEQKEIAAKVAAGEIDILIGTHRLLSKDVQWRDLGLLVVDEEQRFGVAQKERLKAFKKSVDVLAMSATPIPRTLHMSLTGIRDISVIETPPKDRLAIQTAIVSWNDELISEAIQFELARGGQVFFVHNRVDTIYEMKHYLETLIPGLRVIVGHGQMEEKELERSMMAFIERKHDVLLATTIIENGIDIPACNTMLIAHAERFGLSQLYQLRGRVGRSDRLAFCYLLVPSEKALSSDARKRLAAIQEFADLGAGFRIAARDLEIRGSGNILGGEQSGQIAAVGFEMYCKLLEEAIAELRGEKVEEIVETSMSLGINIYIPRDYVADENLRMMFYKKIASAKDEERLGAIRAEMRDRFGAVPDDVDRLLDFVRLKLRAQSIGVQSVAREGKQIALRFSAGAKIDPNRLLLLLGEMPHAKFSPSGVLSFTTTESGTSLLGAIGSVLGRLEAA
ncbi:MAG: transcription-repair coupling factor [Thermoanaerobaculia bacterium]|nr:transcription-repair coupling factor [Thermoanaerobaculia bacterium]